MLDHTVPSVTPTDPRRPRGSGRPSRSSTVTQARAGAAGTRGPVQVSGKVSTAPSEGPPGIRLKQQRRGRRLLGARPGSGSKCSLCERQGGNVECRCHGNQRLGESRDLQVWTGNKVESRGHRDVGCLLHYDESRRGKRTRVRSSKSWDRGHAHKGCKAAAEKGRKQNR